jgi:CRP-like cAMP-binding protein
MHIDSLHTYLENHLALTGEEKDAVRKCFIEKRVKRRQFILQEGNVSGHNTFVAEGCFRMYLLDPNGKEHNLQFAVENWWIGDLSSFYSGEPSRFNIEAIEDSIVLQCRKEDLLRLFVDFPKFNRIFRVLAENALVSCQRRVLQNIGFTAEERYLEFIKRYPNFFNRISNVQIASYLGMTPEFLSAIRKKLSKS